MLRFPLSEVVIHNSGGRPASTKRERRYLDTGSPWPVPLTVVSGRGQGGGLPTRALSHLLDKACAPGVFTVPMHGQFLLRDKSNLCRSQTSVTFS